MYKSKEAKESFTMKARASRSEISPTSFRKALNQRVNNDCVPS